jgi:acetyl-CoA acetyltransferase
MSGTSVAIVGAYETKQARMLDGRQQIDLFAEAIKGALADAGLQRGQVNGIIARWPGPGGNQAFPSSADWAYQLGLRVDWVDDTLYAGPVALQHAVAAISSGQCDTVVIVTGQCGVVPRKRGDAVISYTRPDNEFIHAWGATTPVEFALLAQRHMHLFGTTVEQMAEVASAVRTSGNLNPNAVMFGRGPVSPADVLASREVATPFRLLDLSLISEGAVALVVSNRTESASAPVYIRGVAAEYVGTPYVNVPVYEDLRDLGQRAAQRAFRQSELDRGDIDVFSLYDPTSFHVIHHFEVLGYCDEGEGGPFVEGGRLRITGDHPTNLDGGLLSHAHLSDGQLSLKVKEGVDQLRGRCGERQVAGARNALITTQGGATRDFGVAILSTEAS